MPMQKPAILLIGNHFRSTKSNVNIWHELPNRLQKIGWETIVTSNKRCRIFRLADMLGTIISKRQGYQIAEVDVFSGPSFLWVELSVIILRIIKKPIILTLRGGNLPVFAEKHSKRVQRVLSSAAAVVAPSAYLQIRLSQFRKDIRVIPNPIDIKAYPFYHRTQPRRYLVWVRAFHEIYNPSLAPKMLNELLKDWPKAHLIMVGPDKGDGSLQRMLELASKLGVQDHITITGGVPRGEIPNILQKSEIFINTTNIDNTPVSVIEAMACGLPIVTTRVGGIPWLVEDGFDGLLVPPDDPEAIATAIICILSSSKLRTTLSVNARKKAESFDWHVILPQWISLFEAVINDDLFA
jgi:glycosyltransferase involved in cell wall biosynthesis